METRKGVTDVTKNRHMFLYCDIFVEYARAPEYTDWNLVVIFDVISTMFNSIKMAKVYMVTLMLLKRNIPKVYETVILM